MIDDWKISLGVLATFIVSLVLGSATLTAWQRYSVSIYQGTAALLPLASSGALPALNPSSITAEAYLVRTLSGGALALYNASEVHSMASLTKIMTALLARERGGGTDVRVMPEAKDVSPKHSAIPAGEAISDDAAFDLLLVESDNDVAEAIAHSVGARIDEQTAADPRSSFIRAMNKKAQAIGMRSTHFDNPSGLDSAGQYSTAEDFFLLVRYASEKFEDFWDATARPPPYVTSRNGTRYPVRSSNILDDKGIVGVKTGFSDNAEGALILRYRIKEFPEDFVIVVLRSEDRFGDGERLMTSIRQAFRGAVK